jgi:hypothetical protein
MAVRSGRGIIALAGRVGPALCPRARDGMDRAGASAVVRMYILYLVQDQ